MSNRLTRNIAALSTEQIGWGNGVEMPVTMVVVSVETEHGIGYQARLKFDGGLVFRNIGEPHTSELAALDEFTFSQQ